MTSTADLELPAPARADRVPRRSAARGWTRWLLVAAAAFAALVVASRADYVPIWDGRIYADCAVEFAGNLPLSLRTRCAGHPSQVYVGLLTLVQRLDVGNAALLIVANAALFVLLVLAFARLLRGVFPGGALASDRTLLLAALLVHPVLLTGVVQPSPDFGACVFIVCAAAAAVERRARAMALFGLLASFSKESGAIAFVVLAAAYAVTLGSPTPIPARARRALIAGGVTMLALGALAATRLPAAVPGLAGRWGYIAIAAGVVVAAVLAPRPRPLGHAVVSLWRWARPLLPLALPPLALAAFLVLAGRLRPQMAALFAGESPQSIVTVLVNPQLGPIVVGYLALLLVLGFLWLPSGVIAADAALGAWRKARGEPPRTVGGANAAALTFTALATGGVVFVLTRYPTYTNARYLLPAYPLLLVLFAAALLRLGLSAARRRAALATVVVLLAVSVVRTVDPVSRALWGVFSVGRHDLLRITSLTGECCGHGRDQLVYNLQFTGFADVFDSALVRAGTPPQGTRLTFANDTFWWILGPLDPAGHRSLRPWHREPHVLVADWVRRDGKFSPCLWYVGLPYASDAPAYRELRAYYDVAGRPDTVWSGPYVAWIQPFALRTAGAAPSSPAPQPPATPPRCDLPPARGPAATRPG